MRLVLTIAAIVLIAGFAQASTLTVCPSRCGYASIQAAVYAAHPNDTIEVHSGIYNESVILTKDITFNGIDTGSGEPIVNGDLYQNGFTSDLRGFSFQSVDSGFTASRNMTTPNTTIYWIRKAFENPSKAKAIAALDKIIKANPKDALAWNMKGLALDASGRYEEGISAYSESSKLDPYFGSPWYNKGNDFYELKKYDQALGAYEKAIQLNPNKALYWSVKGDALKALGRTSDSDAAYARASDLGFGNSTSTQGTTTISPTQASTLTVCPSGCDYTSIQTAVYAAHPNDTIEVHSGTYNESVVLTKNIMFKGIDTGSGEPVVNGDLYRNGFNSALHGFSFESISSSVPYSQNMTTPNTTLYWIEKAFENPSKPNAIAALEKIVKTNPKDAWAWFDMGWVLYDAGRYDESMDAFNESIKLDPYFSIPWSEKGNDFYSLNKYDKALEAYEKAIQLDPNYGPYWNNKGDALEALGQYSESDAAYARADELGFIGSTRAPGNTTISPNATFGTNILDHSMASNVNESTASVITRTVIFSRTDSKIYSWLSLGNVGAGTVKWMWYSPDGNLYDMGSVDIPTPSSAYRPYYNLWYYIPVADIPGDQLGNWRVDVSLNGQELLTERFTLFLR